jgi:hypothetical protein
MRKPAHPPKDLVSEVVTERTRRNPRFPAILAEAERQRAHSEEIVTKKPPRPTTAELKRQYFVQSIRSDVLRYDPLFKETHERVDALAKYGPRGGTTRRAEYDRELQVLHNTLRMMHSSLIIHSLNSYRYVHEAHDFLWELRLEQERSSAPKEVIARSEARLKRARRTVNRRLEAAIPDSEY